MQVGVAEQWPEGQRVRGSGVRCGFSRWSAEFKSLENAYLDLMKQKYIEDGMV